MFCGGSIPNPDYQNIYILANLWQQMLHLFKPILPIPRSTSYNHKARKNWQLGQPSVISKTCQHHSTINGIQMTICPLLNPITNTSFLYTQSIHFKNDNNTVDIA